MKNEEKKSIEQSTQVASTVPLPSLSEKTDKAMEDYTATFKDASAKMANAQRKASEDIAKATEVFNEETVNAMQEAEKKREDANNAYMNDFDKWQKQFEEEQAAKEIENQLANAEDQKMTRFGAATEAAAALVNLLGTMHSAPSAQWRSPLSGWQGRADAKRRERESKIQSLQSQLRTLQQQKAQLLHNFARENAQSEQQIANARATGKAKVAELQAQGRAQDAATRANNEMSLAQLKLQDAQQQDKQSATLYNSIIKANSSSGSGRSPFKNYDEKVKYYSVGAADKIAQAAGYKDLEDYLTQERNIYVDKKGKNKKSRDGRASKPIKKGLQDALDAYILDGDAFELGPFLKYESVRDAIGWDDSIIPPTQPQTTDDTDSIDSEFGF